MECDDCKKKDSWLHFSYINKDGQKETANLCRECAEKHGLKIDKNGLMNLEEIIAEFEKSQTGDLDSSFQKLDEIFQECPYCSTTVKEFREKGLLGCPECYNVFSEQIDDVIFIHQKGKVHKGKFLNSTNEAVRSLHEKKKLLKQKLEEAVKNEEYEKAAELRDELNHLENNV